MLVVATRQSQPATFDDFDDGEWLARRSSLRDGNVQAET